MALAIDLPKAELAAFCRQHHIQKMLIFGSALRDDFGPDSDIDVLVEFDPDRIVRLEDLLRAQEELSALLQRPVDLGERRSVDEDPNYLRRKHILSTAQVIYEG